MNFAFGLVNYDDDWDVLQNPYVEFRGHIISTGMKITNSLDFHVCSNEELMKFLPEHTLIWYPQALCITNLGNAIVKNNWFVQEFYNPLIGMHYCQNTTENGSWCKPKDEIDDFLRNHTNFFVHMETYFQSNVFKNDAAVDKFPYNGNQNEYFPTVS